MVKTRMCNQTLASLVVKITIERAMGAQKEKRKKSVVDTWDLELGIYGMDKGEEGKTA